MPRVWRLNDPQCPKDAVNIGRPGKWGNPWRIGDYSPSMGCILSRDEVVDMHKRALPEMLKARDQDGKLIRDIEDLRGKDLACPGNCAPRRCHGDNLLEAANRPEGG